ncbi:MAG: UDP-N-acetylglucosamine 2-epimerase [Candidatus Asgardarchaeum sp.]
MSAKNEGPPSLHDIEIGEKIEIGKFRMDREYVEYIAEQALSENKWVIMVVVGTKPDFYKQYSLLYWAQELDVPVILATTGQHYDELLGYGLKEFRMYPSIDLCIRGDLLRKATEMFYRIGQLGKWLKKKYPKLVVLPIPHGDTLSAAIVSASWFLSTRQGVGQNEAGLRGMAPKSWRNNEVYHKMKNVTIDFSKFIEDQWYGEWFVLRNEPYPEQWDTFVSGAGSAYLFAPHEINKKHLLNEGYQEESIQVVGNSVVDAIKLVPKPEKSIFDIYPKLEEYDNWIRVDIHRRGNLVESRFKSIVEGIISLVKKGQPVVWVELVATREALEFYGLRDKIIRLSEEYENFLFTPLWASYGNVIEFWKSGHCIAELTDSGSVQEELNDISEVLCLTIRCNTDRPESVFDANSNLLVPPVSGEFISKFVNFVLNSDDIINHMRNAKKIYGVDVGKKIISFLLKEMERGEYPFKWVHQQLWDIPPEKSPEYL